MPWQPIVSSLMQPLIQNATRYASLAAIVADGQSYTYQQLLNASAQMAVQLLDEF